MIICRYCHALYISLLPSFFFRICTMSSCTGCILIPSFCHEKSEGLCHLLKCMHRVLCCSSAVFKKEMISQALISVIFISTISISSCIPPILPVINVEALIRTGFSLFSKKMGLSQMHWLKRRFYQVKIKSLGIASLNELGQLMGQLQ